MKHLASLVVLILASYPVQSANEYSRAAEECVLYLKICPSRLEQYLQFIFPEDRDTMCFIRCVGSKLNLWTDRDGLNWSRLENLLCPSVRQQMNECVCRRLDRIDPYDQCPRAYYAFRCLRNYLQQIFLSKGLRYSNEATYMIEIPTDRQLQSVQQECNSCSKRFNPLTVTQMMQKLVKCAKKCNLRGLNLCDATNDPAVDTPEFECTVYCAAISTGVYSEQRGILMDNLYAQLARCETRESFDYRLELCYSRNAQPAGTCPQTVVFRQYLTCLRGDYERFFSSNQEELLQFPGISQFCF